MDYFADFPFREDKSYFRLSALTLSYDFKREWIKKYLGMNMLRLEASTRDLINWNSIRQERGLSYPKSWTVDFSKSTILSISHTMIRKILLH